MKILVIFCNIEIMDLYQRYPKNLCCPCPRFSLWKKLFGSCCVQDEHSDGYLYRYVDCLYKVPVIIWLLKGAEFG